PDGSRLLTAQPLEFDTDLHPVRRPKDDLLAPMRIDQPFTTKTHRQLDQLGKEAGSLASTSAFTAPASAGRSCVRSVRRVMTPKVLPPPPLSAHNKSGSRQSLTTRTLPSAVTISASIRCEAAVPNPFENVPK